MFSAEIPFVSLHESPTGVLRKFAVKTMPDFDLLDHIEAEQNRQPGHVFEMLDSRRQQQTLALELRNQVYAALRSGRPGTILSPRGAQKRQGVVDAAIAMEKQMGGGDPDLLGALYSMKDRHYDELGPREKAKAILDRLLSENGGTLRAGSNEDLNDQDLVELVAAVERYPRLKSIVEEMVRTRMLMRHELERDKKFPSLLSHAAFCQRIDADPEAEGVMLFADISNFKALNDKLGLAFVDEVVLREICNHLAAVCAQKGKGRILLCRQGGDEFMMSIRGFTNEQQAAKFFAQEFRKAVKGVTAKTVQGAFHLLDTAISTKAKPGLQKDNAVKAILASIHALECKIGVDLRHPHMRAEEAEALANSRMTATKAFKDLGFPTVLGSDSGVVINALTGASLPADSREKLALGQRA